MADLRRDVSLPTDDVAYLDSLDVAWETIREDKLVWLVIHDIEVPLGYNVDSVTVALQLPASYPDAQIDMVYFLPHLTLNSRAIPAVALQKFLGRTWQRWSRHRSRMSPWRPGVDNVETHMLLVRDWLQRELEKAA